MFRYTAGVEYMPASGDGNQTQSRAINLQSDGFQANRTAFLHRAFLISWVTRNAKEIPGQLNIIYYSGLYRLMQSGKSCSIGFKMTIVQAMILILEALSFGL